MSNAFLSAKQWVLCWSVGGFGQLLDYSIVYSTDSYSWSAVYYMAAYLRNVKLVWESFDII